MQKLVMLLTAIMMVASILLTAADTASSADAGSKDAAKMSTTRSANHKLRPELNPQPLPPGLHGDSGGTEKAEYTRHKGK
jgi:hypothetical protein